MQKWKADEKFSSEFQREEKSEGKVWPTKINWEITLSLILMECLSEFTVK